MNRQIVKLTIILTFVLFLFIGKTNTVFGGCNGTYICNVRDIDGDCIAGTNIKNCSGSYEGACLNSISCGVCGWASSDCWWSTPCDPTSWSACTESCGGGTKTNACGTTVDCNTQACCNPNCNCAADICVGEFCRNSCDTADCPGTKVDESLTSCSGTQVQYTETPQTTGTIWAKAIGCTSGVTSVTFPTWNSYNGQDDIVWYSGANQGSGTWQSTFNISSHQPALGSTISVHIYENGICRLPDSPWEWVEPAQTVMLAPKTCAVTINTPGAVSSQASGINITATGNAHINPGSDTVRVWITRDDMGVIPGGVTYDYGGNTGIAAINNGSNYYSIANAYRNSVNSANTSATFTIHAPPGNYRVHCDLPNDLNGNLVKCSGNPTCISNGGSTNCANDGWKDCSALDNVSVCFAASCTPFCGQSRTCGLPNCLDTDDGAPNVPVFSNANNRTVTSMPVSFTWSTGGGKTDYYNKSLDNGSAVNIGNVLTVSNISVATTGWHNLRVQSVGSTCNGINGGLDASSWSDPWSAFCYETQNCSPKCGQDLACSATNCLNDDNGAPGAPTIISPKGTSLNPAIFPINSNINFDWSSNSTLTEYYRVIVRDAGNTIVASDTGVSALTTAKIFGPFSTSGLYRWYVDAVNSTCNGINGGLDVGPTSVNNYFRINSPPTLNLLPTNYLVLQNSVAAVVLAEPGNKNQICQTTFANSPATPRQIKLVVTATDTDGGNEISSIAVRLNVGTSVNSAGGVTGQWDLVSPVSCVTNVNNRICTFHMSLRNALDISTLYNLEASATDIWGATTGWIDSGRDLKIWDCQVPVSGSLYDKTGITVGCDWTALQTSSLDINFKKLSFNTNSGVAVVMNVTPPKYTSPAGGLTWGDTYISVFNEGSYPSPNKPLGDSFLASGIDTRITDLGAGTAGSCPPEQFNIGTLVSAYSANPEAQIDFSFVEDQEAWYQVEGAGVKSAGPLSYGVPVTVLPITSKFLTLGGLINDNGLVSATNFTNLNGNNLKDDIGSPNNWYVPQNTNDINNYNYNYFYNNFFVKAGVGETKTTWGNWATDKKIYFVNTNLNINSTLAVPNGQTVMVIVSGSITIDPTVTRLDGIYIADGSITAGGTSGTQLVINGMLYAGGDVRLYRSFTDKTKNNTEPAVRVNYSPGLIFNLDPKVLKVLSGWREE